MLTQEQIALVKATVPVLREHGVALTSHFYKRMLSHNPELMQVFNQGHQRVGAQQQALAGAVLAYAENIENLGVLLNAVKHIANKHVSVGIRAEHYPIVGKHLLASIREVLGEAATPELIDAWAAAYGQLANVLIDAEKALYDKHANEEGGWSGWRFFKVEEKKPETDEVTSFTVVPVDHGKMPKVKAGQYVSVRVYVKKENLIQPRQYTVTDATKHSLRISVKKIVAEDNSPAGMVSNALHQDINQGDLVEVSFPTGEFNVPEGNNPLCLISAGIGITPMLAMLKEAVAHNPQRQVTFVHICKEKKDYPLFDEVEALSKSGPVELVTCVTSKSGRPDEAFFTSLVKPNTEYLVCGPVDFMKDATQALEKANVAKEHIFTEKFGTGAI
ncbi:NO-inducible flavohemoprotein [uncultured Turicimonas sp.]|uniref:NO-inducible flavohemoprotein n=1 Tax=uncultured Turicimonas sp. TaxID=1918607 RepID=UPI00280529FC|nr:NO-inducible flavohemoprotein [uncultured Turicimonas sp.]